MNFYKKLKNKEEVETWIHNIYNTILDNNTLCSFLNSTKVYYSDEIIEFPGDERVLGCQSTQENTIDIFMLPHVGKSVACLIDTFCHEMAHIHIRKHNRNHTHLKMRIKKLVKALMINKYGIEIKIAA